MCVDKPQIRIDKVQRRSTGSDIIDVYTSIPQTGGAPYIKVEMMNPTTGNLIDTQLSSVGVTDDVNWNVFPFTYSTDVSLKFKATIYSDSLRSRMLNSVETTYTSPAAAAAAAADAAAAAAVPAPAPAPAAAAASAFMQQAGQLLGFGSRQNIFYTLPPRPRSMPSMDQGQVLYGVSGYETSFMNLY
jgi:hypothetical protein